MPTEAKDIFEAHSKSLRELLTENGLGLYLPPYQRPYTWSGDKVEKLIDDTLHGLHNLIDGATDSFTFLGTVITIHDINHVTILPIVKDEVPAKVLTVIDGQQRISSLLLLIACLHNLIRQKHWNVFKGKSPAPDDEPATALHEETITLLKSLGLAFYQKQDVGDTPIYPRLIRSFSDQWAKRSKLSKYMSPIAHLLYDYGTLVDAEDGNGRKPTDFRPTARAGVGDGEVDLIKRFTEMRSDFIKLARGDEMEEFEPLPPLNSLAENPEAQRALFNHPLKESLCNWIKVVDDPAIVELTRLAMLGAYALNRIALTVVKGKDEDYAFTIFESLNTTGEPLTAFETFLPRVVMAESIENYQNSKAHEQMAVVQEHLSQFPAGDRLQNATRELLVTFALAETGTKLSKRLADQRVYLKEEFDKCKDEESSRLSFLGHLKDTATFVGETWECNDGNRKLVGLETSAMTDAVRLCLAFLVDLKHTVTIAPLVRFYSEALRADDATRQIKVSHFEEALKAITAFTVLWRASRSSTGNIDREYREIMAGSSSLTGMDPLARRRRTGPDIPAPTVDVDLLKSELRHRLVHANHGDLSSLETWLNRSREVPLYNVSRPLTRFLLLAAYHDSVEDPDHPGLIKPGKAGVAPCLTGQGWADDGHLTIEHIAPRTSTSGWDEGFYTEKATVHQIGNLVLAPGGANSSLSSRPWAEKRVLYGALGARTPEDAKKVLQDAGMTFAQTTEELAGLSHYLPHLNALYQRHEPWTPGFMAIRAERLLRLAYARLSPWLGLDLPHAD